MPAPKDFQKFMRENGSVLIAEGYLFELERRGYLSAGAFVPDIVLDRPDIVRGMHEEFVHSGSDVVLALTYYGHREKLKLVGREAEVETMNRRALQIAREVATETGTLMAGNLCNTTLYDPIKPEAIEGTKAIFKEGVEWAASEGADFIVAETFSSFKEAELALDAIKQYGEGLPAVVTMIPHGSDHTTEKIPFPDAMRRLEEQGAAVVGLNCSRGPRTMMPVIREIKRACKGPIAAVPSPYRTRPGCPSFHSFKDPETGKQAFPTDLAAHLCGRTEIEEFARDARELGVEYVGLCCGSASNLMRVIAEEYGRDAPALKYKPDMTKHLLYGTNITDFATRELHQVIY